MPPRDVVAVVSTHGQEASRHTAAIRRWAAGAAAEVIQTYRPTPESLGELLADVRRGVPAEVVVPALAVLGDVVHQEAFAAALERAGGRIVVLEHQGDDTADVRALLREYDQVAFALAAREKSAQLQRGVERVKQETGATRAGGRAPFGMRLVAGELVEAAEEEAARVRMLELYDNGAGMGYAPIARQLQAEGYLTKDGKETWHPDTVRRIILRSLRAA